MRLRQGELSGVEAFGRRLLEVRGNLDYAVGFEGMFRLPNGRPPLLQIHDIPVGRHRISTMTMGRGPDVFLLHGLGGTRASLFETAARLSRRYRVHAPDLPGFGSSSKPPLGAYDARWFADIMIGLMDQLDVPWAHVVGNSLGGRIAIEMGARSRPSGSAPLVCFAQRLHGCAARFTRSFACCAQSLGCCRTRIRRSLISTQFWSMFHDRDAIDPAVVDLVVDEFRRIYHSPGARYAFWTAARNIYLEAPFGRHGFYPRLAGSRPPALWIWGSHDPLVPAAFSRHVAKWLPDARADHARPLRTRPAGRAPGRDQRPADVVLRSGGAIRAGAVEPDPAQTPGLRQRPHRSRWHRPTSLTRPSAMVTSGSR